MPPGWSLFLVRALCAADTSRVQTDVRVRKRDSCSGCSLGGVLMSSWSRWEDGTHQCVPAKRFLLCMSLMILAASQVYCGGCGGFVPCAPPDAVLTPSTFELSFGNQSVGTASSPQTVTLNATGTASSLIDGITISGDFSQTNNCGKSLAPNTSCVVAVVFKPTATGTRAGQLVISQGPSVQTVVGLTGTGQ